MIRPDRFVETPCFKIPGAPLDWTISFKVPAACPHCGGSAQPRVTAFAYLNMNADGQFGVMSISCSLCRSTYVAQYHINQSMGRCDFVGMYPCHSAAAGLDPRLGRLSPMFASLYNQAMDAEAHGHFELSALGLTRALRALVSDYAVKVLKKKPGKAKKQALTKALDKYLPKARLKKPKKLKKLLKKGERPGKHLSPGEYRLLKRNCDEVMDAIRQPRKRPGDVPSPRPAPIPPKKRY